MKTAKPTSSSQNNETNEGLVFFLILCIKWNVRRVQQTLIASQIINLSCIIRVMIMIATTIKVYNTINDTMLERILSPTLQMHRVYLSLSSFHSFLCHYTLYCENTALNLSSDAVLISYHNCSWSEHNSLKSCNSCSSHQVEQSVYNLCWSGVKKGKALNKGCCICAMQVCDPECHCNYEKNLH
jgi:hypothetical protein